MKRFIMAIAVSAFVAVLAVSAFAQGGSPTPSDQPAATPATEPAKAAPAEKPAHASSSHHASHKAVDINSASRDDLMKVPGISDAVADKIIAARPFKSKAELKSKKILTSKEYEKVRAMLVAKQSTDAGTASK